MVCAAPLAAYAEVSASLEVEPSSTEVALDENLSLEFRTTVNGGGLLGGRISEPEFTAPDFDLVNTYGSTTSVQSTYINGQMQTRKVHGLSLVVRAKKVGTLKISNMFVTVDGKKVSAPDVSIRVLPAGQSTSQSGTRQHQGNSQPSYTPLPMSPLRGQRDTVGRNLVIRAEPSALRVYKGQQLILTYALYTRLKLAGISAERYPNANGCIKEELDIPIVRQGGFSLKPATLNGQSYARGVLAQYALFPLKEGPLELDQFVSKVQFYVQAPTQLDEDDDFAQLFNQMLGQFSTRVESVTSDRVRIEVMPLPTAGQPPDFSGLVGDFDITAVADKDVAKVGEAITIKVKVEGQGHTSPLEKLNITWPSSVKLYEDKATSAYHKSGIGERLFDFIVIPTTEGPLTIPPIAITMFDPQSKSYKRKESQSISINVQPGDPNTLANNQNYTPLLSTNNPAAPSVANDLVLPHETAQLSTVTDSTHSQTKPWWYVWWGLALANGLVLAALSMHWWWQNRQKNSYRVRLQKWLSGYENFKAALLQKKFTYRHLFEMRDWLNAVVQEKFKTALTSDSRKQAFRDLESAGRLTSELAAAFTELYQVIEFSLYAQSADKTKAAELITFDDSTTKNLVQSLDQVAQFLKSDPTN